MCVFGRLIKSAVWVTMKWQTSQTSVDHHHHASLSIHPPPTTKAQLGPTDSCTSLPLWLTQLGFSSFILNPISLISSRLILNKNPPSGQFSWRTNANPPPFVSNSVRHFVVFVIQLHLCSSIPSLRAERRRRRQAGRRLRTTGEVTPGSVSVIFDRGREERAGQLSQ